MEVYERKKQGRDVLLFSSKFIENFGKNKSMKSDFNYPCHSKSRNGKHLLICALNSMSPTAARLWEFELQQSNREIDVCSRHAMERSLQSEYCHFTSVVKPLPETEVLWKSSVLQLISIDAGVFSPRYIFVHRQVIGENTAQFVVLLIQGVETE